MKRYVKLLPAHEPLCRPASPCHMRDDCQRFQQQTDSAHRIGDFKDRHRVDIGAGTVVCSMRVPVEYIEPGAAQEPRHFKHWTDRKETP